MSSCNIEPEVEGKNLSDDSIQCNLLGKQNLALQKEVQKLREENRSYGGEGPGVPLERLGEYHARVWLPPPRLSAYSLLNIRYLGAKYSP